MSAASDDVEESASLVVAPSRAAPAPAPLPPSPPSPSRGAARAPCCRCSSAPAVVQASALLVLVALMWTASSDVVQLLLRSRRVPGFVSSLNNAQLALLLAARGAREAWARRRRRAAESDATTAEGVAAAAAAAAEADAAARSEWALAAHAALAVAPPWFLAQLAFGAALARTSVTSLTVLSASSGALTLALESLLLRKAPGRLAAAGVVFVLAGAALAGVSDAVLASDAGGDAAQPLPASASASAGSPSPSSSSSLGDALALFSAACYAAYSVLLSRSLRAARPPPVDLVLGFVGLAAVLVLSPLVLAMHAAGAEDLSGLPLPFVGVALAKGLVDNVLASQLWARAVALGGPVLATLALSLTVPLAAASDALLLQGRTPSAMLAAGCAATVAGFVCAAASEAREGGEGEGEGARAPAAEMASRQEEPGDELRAVRDARQGGGEGDGV